MRRTRSPALPLVALCLWAAPRAAAQDPPPRSWNLSADLGLVNTAGNTNITTLNIRDGFDWHGDRWGVTQTFALVYSRDEGATTAELWQAAVRGDRRIGGIWRVYGMLAFSRNPFAGVAHRFEETVGLLARPVDTPRDSLEIDVGVSVAQQWLPDTDARLDYGSARLAMGYRHTFREKAFVLASALVLPNLRDAEDVRFQGELAVGAPFNDHLALKASYAVIYDNVPDTPELEGKVDRYLTAALQVRF